ncbi:3-oxoacyl-[acyl-carrier-protein] synthase, partial [human gut metagenome]
HQTIGLENEDEECDLNYMKGSGEKCTVKVALSNSLGFGGHNGTLAVKNMKIGDENGYK